MRLKEPKRVTLTTAILSSVFMLFVWGVVGFMMWEQYRTTSFSPIWGTVIESREGRGGGGRRGGGGAYWAARYEYEFNGAKYQGTDSVRSFDGKSPAENVQLHPPGSQIIVYVDPDNASESSLNAGLDNAAYLGIAVFGSIGSILVAGVWILYFKHRRERNWSAA